MLPSLPRKWWLLLGMSLSLAIMFLDQTAVSVALPAMQRDLNANNTEIQWIINAYVLTTACILILGGKLGDIFGFKRMFLLGVTLFIFSSATTALAQSEIEAIISRALQGLGAAFMIPGSNVMVFNTFKDHERGKAMGIQVAISSLFLSLGPLIGGYLTEYFNWRYIFWINLPLGLLSCVMVYYAAPNEFHLQLKSKVDWTGFTLSLLALLAIVFALMQTAEWGWGSPINLSLFVIGFIFIYLFIRYERKKEDPFVDLHLFKDKGFLFGSLILLLIQTNFVARIFTAIYFQVVLGCGAFMAGLLSLASTIPMTFAGPIGGYLRDNYGSRLPVFIGSCLIAASSLWIAGFAWSFNYWYLVPGLIIFACGAPMVVSTARTVSISTIPAKQRGSATGVSNAARSIGSTLGLALMSTIIINLEKLHLNTFLEKAPDPLNHFVANDLSGMLGGAQVATEKLSQLSSNQYETLHQAAAQSFTFGFSISMVVIGLLGLFGIYLSKKLPKN